MKRVTVHGFTPFISKPVVLMDFRTRSHLLASLIALYWRCMPLTSVTVQDAPSNVLRFRRMGP